MRAHKINDINGIYPQRPKKTSSRFRKTLLWLRLILILCFILAILVLFGMSPLFNIAGFHVQNSAYYDKDTLIDLSNVSIGDNGFKLVGTSISQIFQLRYGKSEQNILKHCPYIKEVKVKYEIPNLINISYTEREPAGYVPYLGSNLVIDNESHILDIIKNVSLEKLPVIKGLKFSNYELGQKLLTENPESLNAATNILDIIKASDKKDRFKLLDMVNSIDVGDLGKICILVDSRIVINLGDTEEMEYKIATTKQILLKNIKKDDKGLLDFTIGENPTFIPDLNEQ